MVNKLVLVITGLCFLLLVGAIEIGDGKILYLHGYSLNVSGNFTANSYCNMTDCYGIQDFLEGGWVSTALTDLDMAGYRLTNVGEIVLSGAIQGQDILPSQNMTYSLGNETNWFLNIFVGNVHSDNISSINLNSTNINSQNITSQDITSQDITSQNLDSNNIQSEDINISNNLTIGGTKITVKDNVTYYKSVN